MILHVCKPMKQQLKLKSILKNGVISNTHQYPMYREP